MKNVLVLVLGALVLVGVVGCERTQKYPPRETDVCYESILVVQKTEEPIDPDCGVGKFMVVLERIRRLRWVWQMPRDFPQSSGIELEKMINSGRYNIVSVTTFYDPTSGWLRGAAVFHNYCSGEGNKIRLRIMLPTLLEGPSSAEGRMKGELHDLMEDKTIDVIKVVKAMVAEHLVGVEVYYREQ